jgi:Xaa-Pro aminopeptidase
LIDIYLIDLKGYYLKIRRPKRSTPIEFDEDFSKLRACKSPEEVARLIDAALLQAEAA